MPQKSLENIVKQAVTAGTLLIAATVIAYYVIQPSSSDSINNTKTQIGNWYDTQGS